jgi:hypothetical protein
MLYRRKLELDIEEIRPELNILRNASQELRSSTKFKQVLQVSNPVSVLSAQPHGRCSGDPSGRECIERVQLSRRSPWVSTRSFVEGLSLCHTPNPFLSLRHPTAERDQDCERRFGLSHLAALPRTSAAENGSILGALP